MPKKKQENTYSIVSGVCLLVYFASFFGTGFAPFIFPATFLAWAIGLVTGIIAWHNKEKYGKAMTITWVVFTVLGILLAILLFFIMLGIFGLGIAALFGSAL